MEKQLFQSDPCDYALQMVEEGLQSADQMLLAALVYMSHDDVRGMLDANELSPRLNGLHNDEEDDENE